MMLVFSLRLKKWKHEIYKR